MSKRIKVSHINQSADFENGFFFKLLDASTEGTIEYVTPDQCDLLIVGPYRKRTAPSLWNRVARKWGVKTRRGGVNARSYAPLTLYASWENTTRYEPYPADYVISQDFGVVNGAHHRLPLWMAMLDWSHEGIYREELIRFGKPIATDSLTNPIGWEKWKKRKQYKAALIGGHLREPRSTLLRVLSEVMPVDGFGPAFDRSIAHHNRSGFKKRDIYTSYGFALCPENSTFPGYYTEKIPEAFACECVPITWADSHLSRDFNRSALINLWDYAAIGYGIGLREELGEATLKAKLEEPLLLEEPSLAETKKWLGALLSDIA